MKCCQVGRMWKNKSYCLRLRVCPKWHTNPIHEQVLLAQHCRKSQYFGWLVNLAKWNTVHSTRDFFFKSVYAMRYNMVFRPTCPLEVVYHSSPWKPFAGFVDPSLAAALDLWGYIINSEQLKCTSKLVSRKSNSISVITQKPRTKDEHVLKSTCLS